MSLLYPVSFTGAVYRGMGTLSVAILLDKNAPPPPLPTACIKTEGRDPRSPSPFHNRLLIGPLFSKLCVGSHSCCESECQLMPGCQHSTPLPIPPALTFFLHLHLQCLQCPLSLERTGSEAPILAGHSLVNYLFSVF